MASMGATRKLGHGYVHMQGMIVDLDIGKEQPVVP